MTEELHQPSAKNFPATGHMGVYSNQIQKSQVLTKHKREIVQNEVCSLLYRLKNNSINFIFFLGQNSVFIALFEFGSLRRLINLGPGVRSLKNILIFAPPGDRNFITEQSVSGQALLSHTQFMTNLCTDLLISATVRRLLDDPPTYVRR